MTEHVTDSTASMVLTHRQTYRLGAWFSCMTALCCMQVVGVNEINEEVVPFSEAGHILREQDMKGNPLTHLITNRLEDV